MKKYLIAIGLFLVSLVINFCPIKNFFELFIYELVNTDKVIATDEWRDFGRGDCSTFGGSCNQDEPPDFP